MASHDPDDTVEVELVIPSRPQISVQHDELIASISTWAADERLDRVEFQSVDIPFADLPAVISALQIIASKVLGE